MKKLLLSFLLFVSFLCKAQQSIIVGPQGDCDTKGIRKNEHASSKWFDVSGVAKLKITTLQHRTFDKSRIYNESGNLIWEWGGESFNDTWYEKVHIVAIKENKIRVEFYQGYSDPFCNGSIKVEKEDREIIPQMQIVKNKGNGVYLEEKKAVVIQNSQSNNITESSDCSDIVKAYELAVRKNITALRKINNNAFVSQNELISLDNDIRKWQNIVMKKCAYDPKYANRVINIMEQLQLGYNSTFPSIKENSNSSSSSSSNTSNSNSGKKGHEFNVIVKWQKTCGNCPFPSPSIQNGVLLSQPSPRGGYYNLQPICPVCGKKPYGELSGNTNNMIEGNKTFRVVCKGN